MQRTIVFIYNADSDIWIRYFDFAHKIISPSTYSCDLCSLTHGSFLENKIWKKFRETIPHKFVFEHKDEFLDRSRENECSKFQFPIILEQKENKMNVLMSTEELSLIGSTEDLIEILQMKLA